MDDIKRQKIVLLAAKLSTVAEFLQLTLEEEAIIEIRLALSKSGKR